MECFLLMENALRVVWVLLGLSEKAVSLPLPLPPN